MKFSNCLFSGIYKINVICLGVILLIHTLFGSQKSCYNKQSGQGMPYFFIFTAFPTVFDLAEANEEQV
jgi:hypothetical protein